MQQRKEINLKNRKKKSNHKKITGFQVKLKTTSCSVLLIYTFLMSDALTIPMNQFVAGSSSEVLVTSADSRTRVVDGVDLVHKFKGKQTLS